MTDIAMRNLEGWLDAPPDTDARALTIARARAAGSRTDSLRAKGDTRLLASTAGVIVNNSFAAGLFVGVLRVRRASPLPPALAQSSALGMHTCRSRASTA